MKTVYIYFTQNTHIYKLKKQTNTTTLTLTRGREEQNSEKKCKL